MAGMARLYAFLIKRAWLAVVAVALLAAAAAVSQLGKLGIEFQTSTLLDEKDPELEQYKQRHDTASWSKDEFAVVCASGLDWVSPEGVEKLRALVADLQQSPEVGRTFSLLDIPLLRQQGDQRPNLLALASGMKHLGDAEGVNFEAARTELLDHELATGTLISKNGQDTNVLVYLKPEAAAGGDAQARWEALVKGLHTVKEKWKGLLPGGMKLAGVPVVYSYIMERVAHDLRVFGIAAALLFSAGLFFIYRRVRFVLLPLVCSVLPVLAVLGFMAVSGIRFTVITSNMPLLLFVLALPYTVYLIERYLEWRREHPGEENADSIVRSARAIWMPCLFSTLTTRAGFAAFATSGIVPVRLFGLMMAGGALAGLLLVFVFFPSALRPWPVRPAAPENPAAPPPRRSLASHFAVLTLARPGLIILASAALLAFSIVGAFRITAENKFTSYFWPSSEVYQGLEFIDRELGGTSTLEVYLTSPQPGYFKTAEGLQAVAAVEAYFKNVPEVGSLRSLPSLTREARKTFKAEWFPAMTDQALLTLVQGMAPELFQDIMTDDGAGASLQVRLQETAPTLNRRRIIDGLHTHLAALEHTQLKGLGIETTGIFVLYANMLTTLIESHNETLWFVVAAIYLMLLFLFRSVRLSLVVLLPQALPAVTMLGVMGWCGIPLDLVTVMISAIALGVGVDSAIQYTMRFREEFARDGDIRASLRRSHATVGRAIWIATTIIVVGFGVLVTSDFFPSVWFGLFTGLAMLMSQFSALLTLPALFLWLGPKWRLFAGKNPPA